MQIIYEPHPVSIERKAELRARGLTIIDAIFKPIDTVDSVDVIENVDSVETKKRGRPAKD